MNEFILQMKKHRNSVRQQRSLGWSTKVCAPASQLNILSILVIIALISGVLCGTFKDMDAFEWSMLSLSAVGLFAIPLITRNNKNEPAAIVFYISLNLLSLITFQLFEARPVETVLTYVFLLSLVVFLFETFTTRIVCLSIVLARITYYTVKVGLNAPNDLTFTSSSMTSHLVFTGILLVLIALVFGLYGWKLFLAEAKKQQAEVEQRQKTMFAQHMSHDLQVSFRSLKSTIELMRYQASAPRNADPKLLAEVNDASNFVEYILNNFLEFARRENARMGDTVNEMVDLAAEMEKLIERYRYEASEKKVDLELTLDSNLPSLIITDKVKVIRIAINLLTNAINHTRPNKKVDLKIVWKDVHWQMIVENDGPTIRQNEIERLFQPHEAIRKEDGSERLGLGLPITKQLVDSLDGEIAVSSGDGLITVFTVTLPTYKPISLEQAKDSLSK